MLFRQTAAAALLSLISTTTAQNSVATVYRYVDSTATIYANYCPCPATVNGIVAPTSGASSGSAGSGAVAGSGSSGSGAVAGSGSNAVGGSGSSGTGSSGTGSSGTGSGAGVVVVPGSGSGTGSSGLTPIAGGAPGFQIYISISVGVSVFVTAGVTSTVTTSTPVTITVPASTTGTGGAGVAPVQTSTTTTGAPFGNGTVSNTVPSVSTGTTAAVSSTTSGVVVIPTTTGLTTSTSGTSLATLPTTGVTTSTISSSSSSTAATTTRQPTPSAFLIISEYDAAFNTAGGANVQGTGGDGAAGLGSPKYNPTNDPAGPYPVGNPDLIYNLDLAGSTIAPQSTFAPNSVFAYNPDLANSANNGAPIYYQTVGAATPAGETNQVIPSFTFGAPSADATAANVDGPNGYTTQITLPGFVFFFDGATVLRVITTTEFQALVAKDAATAGQNIFLNNQEAQTYLFVRPNTA